MATLLSFYVGAGLLLIGLSVPLIRRKVRPNAWYGFRVRQTLADPDTWYAANAYAGKWLLGVGVITVLTAGGLNRVPGITLDAYALACAGIILAALTVCVIQCFRYLVKLAGVRHDAMRQTSVKGIKPPQMPKHLAAQALGVLVDHAEYTALRLAKGDFTGQNAADVLSSRLNSTARSSRVTADERAAVRCAGRDL